MMNADIFDRRGISSVLLSFICGNHILAKASICTFRAVYPQTYSIYLQEQQYMWLPNVRVTTLLLLGYSSINNTRHPAIFVMNVFNPQVEE